MTLTIFDGVVFILGMYLFFSFAFIALTGANELWETPFDAPLILWPISLGGFFAWVFLLNCFKIFDRKEKR